MDGLTKLMQVGLGVVDITREQAEKLYKEVTKNRDVHTKEGRKMVDKFMADAKKATQKLDSKIESSVKSIMKKSNFATKKDIELLEKKLDKLSGKKPTTKKKATKKK